MIGRICAILVAIVIAFGITIGIIICARESFKSGKYESIGIILSLINVLWISISIVAILIYNNLI